MGAFGAAAAAGAVALMSLVGLRSSGGWARLRHVRNGDAVSRQGHTWDELATFERSWFFIAPAFAAAAVLFVAIGLLVTW
jgi:hypothetical protein